MIERGDIGTPLTALTLLQSPGPESWHPNPAFLFQDGAGPLFDMGPYYLTTLVQTFGPFAAVAAVGSKATETRVIGSGPKAGEEFDVDVPTHVSAIAQFESAAVLAQHLQLRLAAAADRLRGDHRHRGHHRAAGPEQLRRRHQDPPPAARTMGRSRPTTAGPTRGIGVLDMARAIRAGRPHRATGALAFHVLDTMARSPSRSTPAPSSTCRAPSRSRRSCRTTGTSPRPPCDHVLLDRWRTLVFSGDSVTDCGRRTDPDGLGDGYVRNLYDDLGPRRPRIVNAGISGNRAADLAARWSADVLAHEPSLVSILIGINDTWRRYDEDDPTTAESFEESYRAMLDPLTCPVVVMEPFLLPVKDGQEAWREDLDPKLDVVRKLAVEYGAILVPADVELNRQAAAVGAATLAARRRAPDRRRTPRDRRPVATRRAGRLKTTAPLDRGAVRTD